VTPADRQRLAAILGMLGSAHAGERAAAALQAETFRRKHGLTWAEMLNPVVLNIPTPREPEPPPTPRPPDPPAWVYPEPTPQDASQPVYYNPKQRYDDRFYPNLFTVISIVCVSFILVMFFGH
jgi:hypothetical protein